MKNKKVCYQLHETSFAYKNKEVLSGITLDILANRTYGLIGPNGSGKTTLLDLLTATRKVKSGRINLFDRPIDTYSKKQLAKEVALVPQEFSMGFEYRVKDIVLMGRHPYLDRFSAPSARDREQVEKAMEEMDILHLRNRPVTELSGGEKQRVVVARALAQETKILVLDEATSNLDIHHTLEIMRVLQKRVRKNDICVIAAIHDLNLAASFCDEFIVLKEGRLFTHGPGKEVLNKELIHDVFGVKAAVWKDSTGGKPRIHYSFHELDN